MSPSSPAQWQKFLGRSSVEPEGLQGPGGPRGLEGQRGLEEPSTPEKPRDPEESRTSEKPRAAGEPKQAGELKRPGETGKPEEPGAPVPPSAEDELREPATEDERRQPASEDELRKAEQRLGTTLPPDLRRLLATADGHPRTGLLGTATLRRTDDPAHDLVDAWCSFEEVIGLIADCLVVVDDGNGYLGLLKTDGTTAYAWEAGDGMDPRPLDSLQALLEEVTSRSAADGLPRTRPATASR